MHAVVDSGCDENVHQMCELPNQSRVLVATEVMALWLHSGDRRAPRANAVLGDGAANHTFRFVRRSERISVTCQREISHNRTSGLHRWVVGDTSTRDLTRNGPLSRITYELAISRQLSGGGLCGVCSSTASPVRSAES